MPDHACYRIATVAERWDCSPSKVRNLIASGQLTALRLGGKMLRIPVAAVIEYEARCQTQTDPASSAPPAAPRGSFVTPAVASLRAARIAHRLRGS